MEIIMKILICGPEGSGKTTLAMPFAELINAVYVNRDTYTGDELRGYVDGIVDSGKAVVIDKRCNTNTRTAKTERPYKVDYHIAQWFDNTHETLMIAVDRYQKWKNKKDD